MSRALRKRGRRSVLHVAALSALFALGTVANIAIAAVTSSTVHDVAHDGLNGLISNDDLIQGRDTADEDVFENPTDSFGNPSLPGWHPANADPEDQLTAFTDGLGIRSTGLSGLINDNFPVETASGRPAKIVEYPFDAPIDIGRINIFSGNRNNADGRIFSTVFIEYSTGGDLQPLGYFQSDPSGVVNSETAPVPPFDPAQSATLLSVFDDASATMITGVTSLVFNLYSVDNSQGQNRDPFDGENPFTTVDDGLTVAFSSPLIFEIDVLAPQAELPGDFNHDGSVDAADYTVWRDGLGTIFEPSHYDEWKTNFGASSLAGGALGGPNAVPESSTIVLAMVCVALVTISRNTRTSANQLRG